MLGAPRAPPNREACQEAGGPGGLLVLGKRGQARRQGAPNRAGGRDGPARKGSPWRALSREVTGQFGISARGQTTDVVWPGQLGRSVGGRSRGGGGGARVSGLSLGGAVPWEGEVGGSGW